MTDEKLWLLVSLQLSGEATPAETEELAKLTGKTNCSQNALLLWSVSGDQRVRVPVRNLQFPLKNICNGWPMRRL